MYMEKVNFLNLEKVDKKDIFYDVMNEPIAIAEISNKKNEYGTIKNINLLFAMLFGYSREEIIKKKIDLIIPVAYSSVHD